MPVKCAAAGCWLEARTTLLWTCRNGEPARLELCEKCHTEIEAAEGLAKCLREMIEANPAFHSKPCGAPGSEARIKQDRQIAAEDAARTALEAFDCPLR